MAKTYPNHGRCENLRVQGAWKSHKKFLPRKQACTGFFRPCLPGKAELWRESCHQGAQGKLNSGDKVAIKVLSESRKGTKEFLNEPNITHHNLLHGCCLDGGKRYQHLFSISEDLNSKEESSKQ